MEAKTEDQSTKRKKQKHGSFWTWLAASVLFRLVLIYFPKNLNLSSRPEVSTPLTSLRRLAEGYWLKQSSMSPYAGSMYHGSPLLLSLLGPLTVKRIEGQPNHLLCSLVFVVADILNAMLIRATGQTLQVAYRQSLKLLDLVTISESSEVLPSGDIAALVYLWNPLTIVACVGLSTSPIENFAIILALFGACKRLVPLTAFGWVMATHLSLYPMILIIPMILLLGYGPDTPRKLLLLRRYGKAEDNMSIDSCQQQEKVINQSELPRVFSWRPVMLFLLWAIVWSAYVLFLCGVSAKQYGSLREMFERMYGFILTVQDLSPNIGVLCIVHAFLLLSTSPSPQCLNLILLLEIQLCTLVCWAGLLMNCQKCDSRSASSAFMLAFSSLALLCTTYGYGGALAMQISTSLLQLLMLVCRLFW
ncbi:uncharacterized protein [Malus domestica]|uniref:uncharacterized protein isoform X3 n=2 Tax=Malus domestica TaxID=3750 RepID=UPI00397567B9